MTERLQRLRPAFQDPHRQALHAALVGGRRGSGPQAFDLTAPDASLVGPFGLMLQAPHLGEPLEELDGIRAATFGEGVCVDPAEAVAHRLTGRLVERRPLDDDTYAAGVARLGEQGVLELVVLVGYYAVLAQLMEVFGVEAPEAGEPTGTD